MSNSLRFRFCPQCATELEPFRNDNVDRHRCPSCGWIHYRNPTAGVAVIIVDDGRLLLGRRRDGGWCIPCGHVEWNEDIEHAARREMAEETGLDIELAEVVAAHSNFHDPEHHTVGVWFRGTIHGGELRPGGDLLEVAFVTLDELPPLKFPTDARVVEELRPQSR